MLFIVTNQPDVFTKDNTKKNVLEINDFLKKKLPITKIFTCYCKNNKCTYRKPNIGMIIKATQIYNLDLSKSFIIGDKISDKKCANKSNIKFYYNEENFKVLVKKII